MGQITRRSLMTMGTAGAIGLTLAEDRAEAFQKPSFSFVHITDTHIQPELGATQGVEKAFKAIRTLKEKIEFGLVGGDLVMDAAFVSRQRADDVFDLWSRASENMEFPLHYSVGNHDVFNLNVTGKPDSQSADYGKGLWKKRLKLESSYGAFDHQGWRFVQLDSVGITPAGSYEGFIDDEQIKWLTTLLATTPKSMPMVFLTHFPIFTAFMFYTTGTTAALPPSLVVKNGKTFFDLIQGHNVKAVFQGHTHVLEEIDYLGVKYVTGGAICGDWWKGYRLGVHPEGFIIATVKGDELTWRYHDYGWTAVKG